MFNLVGKRYLFLIISLIVIIPGTVSLFWKGLDLGIDFQSGSSLQFRPSQQVAKTQQDSLQAVRNILKPFDLKDLQINVGSDTNTPGNRVAWVQLNTQVDGTVQDAIQKALDTKYGKGTALVTPDPLQVTSGGKTTTVTVLTIVSKSASFKQSDLEAILNKLPNTTDVTNTATASPTPTQGVSPALTPTVTATPKATGTPSATATPQATGTPAATPTATSTPATNPAATIPVHFTKVTVGSTTDTINILTTSAVDTKLARQIQSTFLNQSGNYLYKMSSSTVSGSVAADTIRNSILAVITASALILLYVWFAFRKVQKPWRYGACAIIALLHDVLVVLGIFSILGWLLHIQVDALFITALLTVVGFSVHDTIVVFDRIRENMQRRSSESFEQVVNASLVQTMSRSLNTSLTVLFTLSALTLFGGESIRSFTFALLIGIFSGTYSSIFNASMLLVIWERGELGLWRFNREARTPDGRSRREARERELARSHS